MTTAPTLVRLLDEAHSILVFTGAGISTSSGIQDYRGPQGVWKTREPVYFQDFMAHDEARVEYWRQKLETWPSIRDARPNPAHEAIFRLEQASRIRLVVTQNIDGLHEMAGTSRERLVEVHGTNLKVECMRCHDLTEPEQHFSTFAQDQVAPSCSTCGGWLKPATISFGQSLRQNDLDRATVAAQEADLVLALGTSLSVYPAASLPLLAARRGVPYVILNRGVTGHDNLDVVTLQLDGDVVELLPRAVDEVLAG